MQVFSLVPRVLQNHVPTNQDFKALSAQALKAVKPKAKEYKLTDEHGVYLLVTLNVGRHWRWPYRFAGVINKTVFRRGL